MLKTKVESVQLKKVFSEDLFLTINDIRKYSGCRINKDGLKFSKGETKEEVFLYDVISYIRNRQKSFSKKKFGSCNELFRQFKPKTLSSWKKIYFRKYEDNFEKSINEVNDFLALEYNILYELKSNSKQKKEKSKKWVKSYAESVLNNTYRGLAIQRAVFVFLSKKYKLKYQESSDKEDSGQIDGYLDGIPFGVKPGSNRNSLDYGRRKNISRIIYNICKNKDGISISIPKCAPFLNKSEK